MVFISLVLKLHVILRRSVPYATKTCFTNPFSHCEMMFWICLAGVLAIVACCDILCTVNVCVCVYMLSLISSVMLMKL